jgi:hypothetical protein
MTQTQDYNKRTLHTVTGFCSAFPAFTQGGIRHFIFHAKSNGFAGCIRRMGRKILIDEKIFFEWLDRQNGGVK